METAVISQMCHEALRLVIVLILPSLAVSAVLGVSIALLEAVSQVQDQTIGTCARVFGVLLVLLATAGTLGHAILLFASRQFDSILTVGRWTGA